MTPEDSLGMPIWGHLGALSIGPVEVFVFCLVLCAILLTFFEVKQ